MDKLVYTRERSLSTITLVLGVIAWLLLIGGTFGIALLYILGGFIGYVFAQSAWVASVRGTAVRITPEQLPDLYARLEHCCKALEIDTVPETYILNGNGLFNAFATRYFGRHFVVLLSDVVDALATDPDALNFYIGHELGHIKLKHLTGHVWRMPVLWLPLLGAAYSRAKEYSCDRHGRACCPSPDSAARALVAIGAGAQRWRDVDLTAYTRQLNGNTGFFASFHELTDGYPWLVKRVAVALDPNRKFAGRNPFSYVLAFFVPYAGRAGGGAVGLMVVVAMIGILAAIALPAYQDYTMRAKTSEVIISMSPSRTAIAQRLKGNPKAGLLNDKELHDIISAATPSQFVTQVDAYAAESYGDIVSTVKINTAEGHIYFYTNDSGSTWQCGSKDFPVKYLPNSCRDNGGNNRPAPPEPKADANIGLWARAYAMGTFNQCVASRSKTDPSGASKYCQCVVMKLAEVVPQAEMEQDSPSAETSQQIQTASSGCQQ